MVSIIEVEFLDHITDLMDRQYLRVYYRQYGSTYSYLFVREQVGRLIPIAKTHHGRNEHTFVPGDDQWESPPDMVFSHAVSLP